MKGARMKCMYINEDNGISCRKPVYPDQDYCLEHLRGCQWELRKAVPNAVDPSKSKSAMLCGKLPERGSEFCPKHALMSREEPAERQRWRESMQRAKDRKKAADEALATSPLAAVNPAFGSRA
jgi:hypothetical protein